MSRKKAKKRFRAYCEDCNIQTEDLHTRASAQELCELHNDNSPGCNAKPAPVCWICQDIATHRNQKPPHGFTCEDHSFDIDAVPIGESNVDKESN